MTFSIRTFTTATALSGAAILASCAPVEAPESRLSVAKQQEIQAELDEMLEGRVAGEPQRCVNLNTLGNATPVGDRILIYTQGALRYRNDLRFDCPGLGRDDDILVTEPFGSQLCDGDQVRLVDRFTGMQGPVCRLGMFVPYRKVDDDK